MLRGFSLVFCLWLMNKSTIIVIFFIFFLLGCEDKKVSLVELINKQSKSKHKTFQQKVCKGYGHPVGPADMYCIETENSPSNENAKAP